MSGEKDSGDKPQENKADDTGSHKEEKKQIEEKEAEAVEKPKFPGYKIDKDGKVRKLEVSEYVQGLLILAFRTPGCN